VFKEKRLKFTAVNGCADRLRSGSYRKTYSCIIPGAAKYLFPKPHLRTVSKVSVHHFLIDGQENFEVHAHCTVTLVQGRQQVVKEGGPPLRKIRNECQRNNLGHFVEDKSLLLYVCISLDKQRMYTA
jgi:hypothetical protein